MSILIDIIVDEFNNKRVTKSGTWVVVKLEPQKRTFSLCNRIKDAWRVLLGKSIAVHYFEDEGK